MCKYKESRFYHYQDILNGPTGENLIPLLPLNLKDIPITKINSFLVSGYGGKKLNMETFKGVSLSVINHSTQFIKQDRYTNIFQIVYVGGHYYINPWFEQPSKMFFKDYLVIGRYKENKRAVLLKVSKLFTNRIFKPHHDSICVIGAARNPPTLAHQEAINRDNLIIDIDDYIAQLKESSLGIYLK